MTSHVFRSFFYAALQLTLTLEHRFDENENSLGIYLVRSEKGEVKEFWYDGTQFAVASEHFKQAVIACL